MYMILVTSFSNFSIYINKANHVCVADNFTNDICP